MITTCSKCGRSYEEISREEADRPDRECMACFYSDNDFRIDNVYPESDDQTRSAFLMFVGAGHRRTSLMAGLAECVGTVERDRAGGGWTVSINVPYDRETDSDSEEIGTYESRDRALGVLWARRHNADWS